MWSLMGRARKGGNSTTGSAKIGGKDDLVTRHFNAANKLPQGWWFTDTILDAFRQGGREFSRLMKYKGKNSGRKEVIMSVCFCYCGLTIL